jgi:hypothetical protein
MQMVLPTDALLTLNNAVSAFLDGVAGANVLHLFKNNITPTKNSVVGDFVSADFTGYAPLTPLSTQAPYLDQNGNAALTSPVYQFLETGVVITNTVYGAYVTNAAGTVLFGAVRFDVPVTFSLVNDSANIVLRFTTTETGFTIEIILLD